MKMTNEDYLKKALLDSQERVRDLQNYSQSTDDEELKDYFKRYAEEEAMQASELQRLIKEKI